MCDFMPFDRCKSHRRMWRRNIPSAQINIFPLRRENNSSETNILVLRNAIFVAFKWTIVMPLQRLIYAFGVNTEIFSRRLQHSDYFAGLDTLTASRCEIYVNHSLSPSRCNQSHLFDNIISSKLS